MLLSVIIPTRNRATLLAGLLDSLARQASAPFDWEVLVIDNASTDQTPDIVQKKSDTLPISIRYVREHQPGLHFARHTGATNARGQILSYLDDDMILELTWILAAERIRREDAHAVVGRILPKWTAHPPDWLSSLITDGVFSHLGLLDLGDRPRPVDPLLVFGGACFIPRQLLFDLGGFHPDGVPADRLRFRGDGETALMNRFKRQGLKSFYDPLATAWHVIPAQRLTLDYLCQRAYNQGISDSFTRIRADHALDGAAPTPPRLQKIRTASPTRLASALARKAARAANRLVGRITRSATADAQRRMARAYRDGFRFHRREVQNDPELLQYVLRPDFFDLPETSHEHARSSPLPSPLRARSGPP